jgi:hypothetical protein
MLMLLIVPVLISETAFPLSIEFFKGLKKGVPHPSVPPNVPDPPELSLDERTVLSCSYPLFYA